MTSSAAVAAPPSPAALDVLSGLLRDAVLLAGRGTATPADVDTAMRLGAGHPTGPFEVLAGLTPDQRSALGLSAQLPGSTASGTDTGAVGDCWTGPVGVVGTGHMAGGIVEAVARSGRPVRVLARSAASCQRLLATLRRSLDRAVSRGRLDEAGKVDVLGRVSVGEDPVLLAAADVVVEAVAEDLTVRTEVLAALDRALPAAVPVATNTSSYRVADLRPGVPSGRPILALHTFNPPR
ncbi:3-hydroxyacyl-CoA dehydrogenase NAD-binding domain-containing protein [Geodermatophilus amargosae]|uniref:3-hydroxyacyl-CoA dehydrogenase NAD-binding domain-containing protein n=1 Tax=Geodermatophilus amargosae TaxID=1296565 RepID=UPI0034DE487B